MNKDTREQPERAAAVLQGVLHSTRRGSGGFVGACRDRSWRVSKDTDRAVEIYALFHTAAGLYSYRRSSAVWSPRHQKIFWRVRFLRFLRIHLYYIGISADYKDSNLKSYSCSAWLTVKHFLPARDDVDSPDVMEPVPPSQTESSTVTVVNLR